MPNWASIEKCIGETEELSEIVSHIYIQAKLITLITSILNTIFVLNTLFTADSSLSMMTIFWVRLFNSMQLIMSHGNLCLYQSHVETQKDSNYRSYVYRRCRLRGCRLHLWCRVHDSIPYRWWKILG